MTAHEAPVVVVGGGLAGLTAAALSARAGHPTVLLERSGALGGRARSTTADGYRLNLGPHALAREGPGGAVLDDLGITRTGGNPLSRPFQFLVHGDTVGVLHRRGGGPGARLLPALARARYEAAQPQTLAGLTVGDWFDRLTDDPRTRAALDAVGRLGVYGDALDVTAADYLAEALRAGTVRYLDGGWQRLVDALRDTAIAAGADLRAGARAIAVRVDGGAATGVELADGTMVDAAAVILTAGGPEAMAMLLPRDHGTALRRRAEAATPARMACLDVALAGPAPNATVVLGTDAPLYLSVHSRFADLTPGDGAVVHVARFLHPGAPAPDGTRGELEDLLAALAPDWQERVVHARYLPDLVVTHDLPTTVRGGIAGRAPVDITGIDRLAIAGDWVGPRGTLAQAALASAADAVTVATAGRMVHA